jgi:maltose alpha-D-glucosyltransferase / alpha-amylase
MPEINTNAQETLWYKDAVIYELHIKAFNDGNADGIGDFKGLMKRLDYLKDLGVTAIWLLPFYPSPQRDGGYDIADYYSINPDYGTISQFEKLIKKAHKRGLKVITELVINHTSDQHYWFQRARNAPLGSIHREFYVWSDTTEKYKDVRIIFQDFETSNWTWDPVAQSYYWHRFYSHQPDLNYDSPFVQEEILRIIDFWIDKGVDGFRLDAVPYLYEREGTNCENLPETHEFLKKLRAHADQKREGVLLLAEANMWPEDSAAYFGDGDECHMNYHFPIMPRMFMALQMEDRHPIIDIIDQTPDIPDNCQWGIFLRNHDELTLEMVTDEERDYMYRAYTKDSLSRINLGIRHRLAPLLDNHRQKIELMNCLLFSLPGTPVIYYGDEIGMGDNVHLGDRDGVRTPMQWSVDRNAGFSLAHPQKLYLPLVNDPEYHYHTINVETQQNNSSSLLWWMKRIIAIRKRYPAFGRGDIRFLSPENAKVLAFTRSYEGEHILVLANLSRHPQAVDIELPGFEHFVPIEVFGQRPFPAIGHGANRFMLGPYGYYWFALKAEDRRQPGDGGIFEAAWEPDRWLEIARGNGESILAGEILPDFLSRSERFIMHSRILDQVAIEQARPVSFDGEQALMMIVKVIFTEGFPEWYFLPLTFAEGDPRQRPQAPSPGHVVAVLSGKSRKGFLYEATENPAFQKYLLGKLLGGAKRTSSGFQIAGAAVPDSNVDLESLPAARILDSSGNNLPLAFGDRYFLKIFRRLEGVPNPDVEVNCHGASNALPIPGYLGHMEYDRGKDHPFALALLQPYVTNQGQAWKLFLDEAHLFLESVQANPENISLPDTQLSPVIPPDEEWQALIGEIPLEQARLLGEAVARFHVGLIDESLPEFRPESFSLHYQRSLFSAMQSLVRASFQQLQKNGQTLAGSGALLDRREELLGRFRRIYRHKIEALKIRIHGDLNLEKVLFTGREFYFFDFEGERYHRYSELRLKKTPVRDLAGLLCSFHYAGLVALHMLSGKELSLRENPLFPWAEAWIDGMHAAFLSGYLPRVHHAGIVPSEEEDLQTLFEVFTLERHLYELSFELRRDRGLEEVPLLGILRMMDKGVSSSGQ